MVQMKDCDYIKCQRCMKKMPHTTNIVPICGDCNKKEDLMSINPEVCGVHPFDNKEIDDTTCYCLEHEPKDKFKIHSDIETTTSNNSCLTRGRIFETRKYYIKLDDGNKDVYPDVEGTIRVKRHKDYSFSIDHTRTVKERTIDFYGEKIFQEIKKLFDLDMNYSVFGIYENPKTRGYFCETSGVFFASEDKLSQLITILKGDI